MSASGGAGGQVLLRDGQGRIDGTVVEVAPGGLTVNVEAGGKTATRVVGWDRIKALEGEQAVKAAPMLGAAESLWRVRSRLERGDWLGAEPLVREVLAAYQGKGGPSEVVACDAALRCRLWRGARAGAVGAWLELLGAYERAGAIGAAGTPIATPTAWVGGVISGLPALDARTGLVPTLPPIWVGEPAMDVAAAAGEWGGGPVNGARDAKLQVTAELSAWYVAAARFEASGGADRGTWPTNGASSSGDGVRLVRLIVQARCGDATQRAAARESLRNMMSAETTERWHEAWCRAAIGRSLLRESEPEERIAGVIELLHVPARLSGASPYLAGVCLAEAAAAMWDIEDKQAAAALRAELLAGHPGHPAAAWGRLAEIVAPAPAAAPVATEAKDLPAPPKVERRGR